jgi:hypothetical protein
VFKLPVFAQVPEVPPKAGTAAFAPSTMANKLTKRSERIALDRCILAEIMASSCRRLEGTTRIRVVMAVLVESPTAPRMFMESFRSFLYAIPG